MQVDSVADDYDDTPRLPAVGEEAPPFEREITPVGQRSLSTTNNSFDAVIAWGNVQSGQLGVGSLDDAFVSIPRPVPYFLDNANAIAEISCGLHHTVFLERSGVVYACGSNDNGQLGHQKAHSRPESVTALESMTIVQVSAGHQYTLALSDKHQVFGWGKNDFGQLGIGFAGEEPLFKPKLIKQLNFIKTPVMQVACGSHHSLALTNTGQVYAFGANGNGQLGIGHNSRGQSEPTHVPALTNYPIVQVAAGGKHSLALTISGHVFSWGSNSFGQLGLGDEIDRDTPIMIPNIGRHHIKFIAVGDDHTCLLAANGGVFTCGSGGNGQLGHGSMLNESTARMVMELMGTPVSQIACGRRHTLCLVGSTGRVYAFSLGALGQLGSGTVSNCSTPVASNIEKTICRRIFSGGDHCFALAGPSLPLVDYRIREQTTLARLDKAVLEPLLAESPGTTLSQRAVSYLDAIFGSFACLNGSFYDPSIQTKLGNSHSHLDLAAMREVYKMLFEGSHCHIATRIVSQALVNALKLVSAETLQHEDTLRGLLVVLLLPFLKYSDNHATLQSIVYSLHRLKPSAWEKLGNWCANLDADAFGHIVNVFQCYLTRTVTQPPNGSTETHIQLGVEALKHLYHLNRVTGSEIIPSSHFYNEIICQKIDLAADYSAWRRQVSQSASSKQDRIQTFTFCQAPFLFDAHTKMRLLELDTQAQMMAYSQRALLRTIVTQQLDEWVVVFNIRRDHLVQDALDHICVRPPEDLKKVVKVQFVGEEALDAGGVRKEFFQLLFRELLDPKYGMFSYNEQNVLWFNHASFEQEQMYKLIGLLVGLAIYNSVLIDFPFPSVLYKKLLGEKTVLDDLASINPDVCRSLKYLRDYPDNDVEEVFQTNFQVQTESYGAIITHDLVPNGGAINVTNDNRQLYIDSYVDFLLNRSVETQFKEFAAGFLYVCDGPVFKLFNSSELELLVIGRHEYDFAGLEKVTQYREGYSATDEVIKNFWTVFHNDLTHEEKRKFLQFTTGTDRVPINGLQGINFHIQRTEDVARLPVAHTCFNLLDLPAYPNIEVLRTKLRQAIHETSGFGLV